jgi:hypothetical protein
LAEVEVGLVGLAQPVLLDLVGPLVQPVLQDLKVLGVPPGLMALQERPVPLVLEVLLVQRDHVDQRVTPALQERGVQPVLLDLLDRAEEQLLYPSTLKNRRSTPNT